MNENTVTVKSIVIQLSNETVIEYDGQVWKFMGVVFPRHMQLISLLDESIRKERK